MTTLLDWTSATEAERNAVLARPEGRADERLLSAVREIAESIRSGGWAALVEHAQRIDGAAPRLVEVAPFAARARATFPRETLEAIELAAGNIEAFHRASLPDPVRVEPISGLVVEKQWRALSSAGLYVPGGKAPLFSTLLMLALPARAAGVERLTVVTPPRPDGGLDLAVALAAEQCGIDSIWTVGGAQAIAALAFGAGDISAVDRICGPGNAWVAAAKALVSSWPGGPAIDLPAGPSELMVIADRSADPATVAADLLSQAEHDEDAQVLLVTLSLDMANAVEREFTAQSAAIGGTFAPLRTIVVPDMPQAVAIANRYAPEHLSLAVEDSDQWVGAVTSAGAIFCGRHAAESFGDYLAGSSHVLPTDGAARFTGGVSTLTFLKSVTVQTVSADAGARLARPAAALARLEGLEAHARAAEARAA